MTIARHFNAGLNAENIPNPAGTTEQIPIPLRKAAAIFAINSAVPMGLMAARKQPGVETPGYCRAVPLGRWLGAGKSCKAGGCGRKFWFYKQASRWRCSCQFIQPRIF